MQAAAKNEGSASIELDDGGLAVYDKASPTNLHLAYPGEAFQIEVFSPEDGEALRDAVRQFFVKECPSSVVRAAEPTGFDADLWTKFEQIGGSLVGDDAAGLTDLVLVAEEVGRAAAPLPFVGDVVARRVLSAAQVDAPPGPLTVALADGSPQLVPDAAVATHIVTSGGCGGDHRPAGVVERSRRAPDPQGQARQGRRVRLRRPDR